LLAVVLEPQGPELCPGPFLPTVAAVVAIDRCAPDSVRAQLLPQLTDGAAVGAGDDVALAEADADGARPHRVPHPGRRRGRRNRLGRTIGTLQAVKHHAANLLIDSGYLVPHWPEPWVIEAEFEHVERPDMGITGWVTLTIAQAGSDDQRDRWVEPVVRGQGLWCQPFAEPGAGSDAAAVRTAAKKVDGGQISGQKVWTRAWPPRAGGVWPLTCTHRG
jgi:hypothetical protein